MGGIHGASAALLLMQNCPTRRHLPRVMRQVKALPMKFAASQGEISPSFEPVAMRLLLTRPRDAAEPVADSLRVPGHEPFIAPPMEIRFLPRPEIALPRAQGLIVPRANAIRAFAMGSMG